MYVNRNFKDICIKDTCTSNYLLPPVRFHLQFTLLPENSI